MNTIQAARLPERSLYATIRVFGLSDGDVSSLKEMAMQRFGKNSVSLLAKTLLLAQLDTQAGNNIPTSVDDLDTEADKYRLEVRLLSQDYQYIRTAAQQQSMSANAFVVSILRHYINGHPTLSDKEAEALYQSNYQLLRIGRNLNQIARQLNAGESASLTTEEIRQLRIIIEKHTDVVGNLLLANKKRFE
ncbi:plasmid mobilization relaxosome protein MobC [Snodgrassella sp. CFCC 13594]|uniref:plasmid mobilization relaxosome protein MobC n=1 Tax=Snodgrassella sp. CFCC 13594 TaxID=1775559 RepID=UPI000832F6B2|nr:plasmid mobilization relaxosome protein MobC [Snodgrassella sp. CFCC 13594]